MSLAEQTAGRIEEDALHVAIKARQKPNPASALANALTFAWRALLKIRHTPEQMFDVVITPIMFTVMFTYLFGGALAGSPEEYLQFLLPGILVQTVVFTTIYTGFTLNTDISKGVFDRFRSLPIWKPAPLVGAMLGDTLRYSASAVIVVVIGFIMGFRPATGIPGLLASLVLLNIFAFGLSWVFVVLGLVLRTPGTVMTLSWLVLMPLTFATNIFVDPATMPGWLQAVVAVNPVAILVTAVREILDGRADLYSIGLSLLSPVLLTAALAPVAMYVYSRKR